jgi:hypothetical protein
MLHVKDMLKCAQKSIGNTLPLNLAADNSELNKTMEMSIGLVELKEQQLCKTLQRQVHQLEKEIAILRDFV